MLEKYGFVYIWAIWVGFEPDRFDNLEETVYKMRDSIDKLTGIVGLILQNVENVYKSNYEINQQNEQLNTTVSLLNLNVQDLKKQNLFSSKFCGKKREIIRK